jgi:L-iditol 2-dehydrogenase
MPLYDMWRDEVGLVTSYGASPDDLKASVELLASGAVNVDDLVTHRLTLEETGKGFQLVANAQDSLKVIIEPQRA